MSQNGYAHCGHFMPVVENMSTIKLMDEHYQRFLYNQHIILSLKDIMQLCPFLELRGVFFLECNL